MTAQLVRRGQILVVDGNASIATGLRSEGFEVDEAASGAEALETAYRVDPDIVVLEVMLPDMNGIEVARRIGAQGRRTAILFLTVKQEPSPRSKRWGPAATTT